MSNWLPYVGTALVLLAVALAVAAAVWSLRKGKKNGQNACGGGCGGCPMAGRCHRQNEK